MALAEQLVTCYCRCRDDLRKRELTVSEEYAKILLEEALILLLHQSAITPG